MEQKTAFLFPGQGVSPEDLVNFYKRALEKKAKQTTVLPTTGAFHTSLMKGPSQAMYIILSLGFSFKPLQIPLIANLTGKDLEGQSVKDTLVQSMIKPVQWIKTIQTLRDQGVSQFIEVGPGSSLSALNRLNGVPKNQTKNILDLI